MLFQERYYYISYTSAGTFPIKPYRYMQKHNTKQTRLVYLTHVDIMFTLESTIFLVGVSAPRSMIYVNNIKKSQLRTGVLYYETVV